MPSIDIRLAMSPEACLAYYQGRADQVITHSLDGRRVVFPAAALRRIVGRDGAQGCFRLYFSATGKFEDIQPVGQGGP
ncbi:DUF2835 family protein [Halomonas salifodinae]|uniref:DUF2835 family protein n=1 Tax=Halomonas salifodinae TaxID=438745 RepID=UPI0033BEBB9E